MAPGPIGPGASPRLGVVATVDRHPRSALSFGDGELSGPPATVSTLREGIEGHRAFERVMDRNEPRDATPTVAAGDYTFADMYDVHVRDVYRYVYRRCRDRAMAEDITQDTFMRAILATDDPTSISIGWLITVARNRLVDVLRRKTRYEGKLRLVGTSGEDELDVELTERLRVQAALSELSVDQRLVLTLHYIDGFTVPALAEHLGRSLKSVEGLVTRARRALRAELDEDVDAAGTGGGRD